MAIRANITPLGLWLLDRIWPHDGRGYYAVNLAGQKQDPRKLQYWSDINGIKLSPYYKLIRWIRVKMRPNYSPSVNAK